MCAVKLTYPGVYVDEVSILPPSIAEVESAVPAFVGYTEKAIGPNGSLTMVPMKISNYSEYSLFFGNPPVEAADSITLKAVDDGAGDYVLTAIVDPTKQSKNVLANSIRHFYDNGGGDCYIVSVGGYKDPVDKDLTDGLALVEQIDEVTLLSVPESQFCPTYSSVAQAMIKQASDTADRFALLDPDTVTLKTSALPSGAITTDTDLIKTAAIPVGKALSYAAAYYPNLITTYPLNVTLGSVKFSSDSAPDLKDDLVSTLGTSSALYKRVEALSKTCYGFLPPSAAMAGLIARVDATKGFWKAPANESLASVITPTVLLSDKEQGNLNIDSTSGKSINVIRSFPGYGTLAWGARTLDGNDNEWKYINVRRFFMVVEESIKKSIHWAVFEPNTASTWVKVQAMIENYLFQKWRDGALAGAKPEQAYEVNVGLNKTMNSVDILEGRMIVEIKMAVSRPAEFIVLRFEQMMQTS